MMNKTLLTRITNMKRTMVKPRQNINISNKKKKNDEETFFVFLILQEIIVLSRLEMCTNIYQATLQRENNWF